MRSPMKHCIEDAKEQNNTLEIVHVYFRIICASRI